MGLEQRSWNIARVMTVVMVLLTLRIVYWQLVRGRELQPVALDPLKASADYAKYQKNDPEDLESAVDFLKSGGAGLEDLPQPVVQRTRDLLETIRRGSIYDRNGRLLVEERLAGEGSGDGDEAPEGDGIVRFYNEPSLAHVIGYVSGMGTGVSGLELSYNDTLLGLDRVDSQFDQLLHRTITGSDLILTIDSPTQRAAEKALEGKSGAIIVMDAHSGAVLAMASNPRFDPNRILEAGYASELIQSCQGGDPACQSPFLNRASQAVYTPGSTWKTVTLIAALDTGQVSPDTVFDFGEPISGPNGPYYIYEVDGGIVPDPNHRESRLDLGMSYAKSANAAFARIGDEMPPEVMVDYARRLGFGAPGEVQWPLEIETTPSQIARDPEDLYDNNLLRAVTAIGQGELLATPLNTGMEVLAVLNDGTLPLPYFVHSIREPSGKMRVDLPNRQTIRGLFSSDTAREVRDMMITVVEKGSGQRARISGMTVGGKTGTAQVSADQAPHAWFAGFAEAEGRAVVAVVLIENGGEGSQTAAPIFADIATAAIQQVGDPVEDVTPAPTVMAPTPILPSEQTQGQTLAENGSEEEPPQAPAETETAPDGEPTPEAVEEESTPGDQELPAPDLPRAEDKNDITAGNPTCANFRDMPEATGEFLWPSPYQALSGGDFTESHPGLDLSAPSGSPVYAADNGLVLFAGWSGLGYGNAILIDHGNGYQTLYAHLSQVSTVCGTRVEKGRLIGLSGSTGNSSGPHLHFEVRVPGGYLNPIRVLPIP